MESPAPEPINARGDVKRRLPTITVVTPSYNQAAYLEQTIRSVLDQQYEALEYIVIDGGSTDGSVDIIRKYSTRLAFWSSEKDRGQADAVNKGWRRATGEVLAFLNSDDYYLDGTLRRVGEAFSARPDAGVVYGQGQWVTSKGRVLQTTSIVVDAQSMLDGLVSVPQPAAFVRREVLDRVGMLDEELHFGLDKEFYLRAIANFPVVVLNEPLAALRLHEQAKSVSDPRGFAPEMARIAEKIVSSPQLYPNCSVEAERVRAAGNLVAAQFLYMGGAYGDALKALARAVRLDRRLQSRVVMREVPRLIARALLGQRRYVALSSLYRR